MAQSLKYTKTLYQAGYSRGLKELVKGWSQRLRIWRVWETQVY